MARSGRAVAAGLGAAGRYGAGRGGAGGPGPCERSARGVGAAREERSRAEGGRGRGTGTGTPRSLPELPPRDAHKDTCWQSSCFGTDQPSDGTSFVKGTVGVAASPATRVCSDRWFQAFYK